MDRTVIDLFFALIRSQILGTGVFTDEQKDAARALVEPLYTLSCQHDMAHLIGFSLFEAGLTDVYEPFEKQHMLSVFRGESIVYEQAHACDLLAAAEIPHLPLKGAVLRSLYPEPWMRPSCDVDVLVKENHLDRAVKILCENGYSVREKTSHDVGLISSGHVPTELHFRLWENGQNQEICDILDSVWAASTPVVDSPYTYEMPDELFYFYHVAHMAKHVEHGGCGIRPLLDLWLLDKNADDLLDARNALLEKGGLLRFVEAARTLCRAWFDGQTLDPVSAELEAYVLSGGVYGSEKNRIAFQQQQRGGRVRYALSRIFVPFADLKVHFPVLNKCPWLMPVMHVCRWFKLLFCGGAKRSLDELNYSQHVSQKTADRMKQLLSNLGLQ